MSLKQNTPCDMDCICPFGAETFGDCEWYCGAEEPQDDPKIWEEEEEEYWNPHETSEDSWEEWDDPDWDEDIEDTAALQAEMDTTIVLLLMIDE